MWLDILRLFPQVTVMGPGRFSGNGGRAKRSATFPGIRNLGTNFMSPASRFANNKANANNSATIKNSVKTDEDYEEQDEDLEDEEEVCKKKSRQNSNGRKTLKISSNTN